MTKRTQKGFSIIELLIVVAIIAILILVALPQYQKYIKRTQVSEMLSVSAGVKADLGAIFAIEGKFDGADTVTRINADMAKIQGKYISGAAATLATAQADLTFTFGNKANADISGKTGFVRGVINNQGSATANLQWDCGSADAEVKDVLPKSCTL